MKVLGIIFTLIGALFFYCQHSNQNLLPQSLPRIFKCIGILSLIIGLIFLLLSVPKLVACLVWLIIMIFMWTFVPFIHLFRKELKG